MSAHAHAQDRAERMFYKAVCYRCSYVGLDATITRCPLCEFAIILEPGEIPAAAPVMAEMFARGSGSFPLPGVDATPRQAQLAAEARRQRRSAPAVVQLPPPDLDIRLRPRAAMAFAVVSALVAGVAAAVLMRGGL